MTSQPVTCRCVAERVFGPVFPSGLRLGKNVDLGTSVSRRRSQKECRCSVRGPPSGNEKCLGTGDWVSSPLFDLCRGSRADPRPKLSVLLLDLSPTRCFCTEVESGRVCVYLSLFLFYGLHRQQVVPGGRDRYILLETNSSGKMFGPGPEGN